MSDVDFLSRPVSLIMARCYQGVHQVDMAERVLTRIQNYFEKLEQIFHLLQKKETQQLIEFKSIYVLLRMNSFSREPLNALNQYRALIKAFPWEDPSTPILDYEEAAYWEFLNANIRGIDEASSDVSLEHRDCNDCGLIAYRLGEIFCQRHQTMKGRGYLQRYFRTVEGLDKNSRRYRIYGRYEGAAKKALLSCTHP